jgi:glycogen synthase
MPETNEVRKGPILIATQKGLLHPGIPVNSVDNTFLSFEDPVGLAEALSEEGWEVHVAIPDYGIPITRDRVPKKRSIPGKHVVVWENLQSDLLSFQHIVANAIVPQVSPVLIHCFDCGASLIPAATRNQKIPCLLMVNSFQTCMSTLRDIESGFGNEVDWRYLYYKNFPYEYAIAKGNNPVDILASGIFAAHWFCTGSLSFLGEVAQRRHGLIPYHIGSEIENKRIAGFATAIPYGVSSSLFPERNSHLVQNYGPSNHVEGKLSNKRALQKAIGLEQDDDAPLFLWCSGTHAEKNGYRLMADFLYEIVTHNWAENLEIVLLASGEIRERLVSTVELHGLSSHAAVVDSTLNHAHIVYAAADFMLAPSLYESSALQPKVALVNGCIPIAYETGAIKETVRKMDCYESSGNGFLFQFYGLAGLMWGIEQALGFFRLPEETRVAQCERVMTESARNFTLRETARCCDELYRELLRHPMGSFF